jgi:hypothetical protein
MTSSALLSGLRSMLYVSIGNGLYVERKEVGEPDATFYVPVWTGEEHFFISETQQEDTDRRLSC